MVSDETLKKLRALAEDFYNVCKTLIAVYDMNGRFLCSYPQKMCKFCDYVRSDKKLSERCLCGDRAAFQTCRETRQKVKYHCHMGLQEVVQPIVQDGVILGYLQFGQICEDKTYRLPKAIIQDLTCDLDKQGLIKNLQFVRCRTEKYIDSISKILEMSAAYILLGGYFSLKHNELAYKISDYINKHLSEPLSSAQLCRTFAVSRTTLYHISKEFFGSGIGDYILYLRMEKAKRLLTTTDLPIGEVAEAVGFHDSDYFSKCFKKRSQLTPKQYRKSQKL